MAVTPRLGLPILVGTDSMATVIPPSWNTLFTKLDGQIGFTTCTSSTRPGTPFDGQKIYQTDTQNYWMWFAFLSQWKLINTQPTGERWNTNAGSPVTVPNNQTEVLLLQLPYVSIMKRFYRIFAEGQLINTVTAAPSSQPPRVDIRARIGDGHSSSLVADPIKGGTYCDVWRLTATDYYNLAFEAPYQSASANQLGVVGIYAVGQTSWTTGAVTIQINNLTIEHQGCGV